MEISGKADFVLSFERGKCARWIFRPYSGIISAAQKWSRQRRQSQARQGACEFLLFLQRNFETYQIFQQLLNSACIEHIDFAEPDDVEFDVSILEEADTNQPASRLSLKETDEDEHVTQVFV